MSISTPEQPNQAETKRYDALLFASFGGPEQPDDVIPFLENVTRGRDIPPERLAIVAEQYMMFDGRSPINALNRTLMASLAAELAERGVDLPMYWGNRNWNPYLDDTVETMEQLGVKHALAIVTSAYSGYSGCRQYLEDFDRAVEGRTLTIDKVRAFWNHPGFIEANVSHIREALSQLEPAIRERARLVFTAHSIPVASASTSDYETQLRDAAALVTRELASGGDSETDHDFVFQSRSGPPQVPWLEPDVCDHLATLASEGIDAVVLSPIGFVSDHMEVVYDLDVQAAQVAEDLGITLVRAASAGTHSAFTSALADLIQERIDPQRPVLALGELGPRPMPCATNCCPAPQRRGS